MPFRLIQRFLWCCAGANVNVLATCPAQHVNYSILGFSAFSSAVLAGLTIGFALWPAGRHVALIAVVIWAAIILNLNRFVLAVRPSEQKTAEKKANNRGYSAPAVLFRVVIATIVAVIITVPLDLKLFQAEIDGRKKEIADANTIATFKSTKSKISDRIDDLREQLRKLDHDYESMETQRGKTGRKRLYNPDPNGPPLVADTTEVGKALTEEMSKNKQLRFNVQCELDADLGHRVDEKCPQIVTLQNQLVSTADAARRKEIQCKIDQLIDPMHASRSCEVSDASTLYLTKDLEAFWDLHEKPSVLVTSLGLFFVLWFLETGPVLIKIIMRVSDYDVKVRALENQSRAEAELFDLKETLEDKAFIERFNERFRKAIRRSKEWARADPESAATLAAQLRSRLMLEEGKVALRGEPPYYQDMHEFAGDRQRRAIVLRTLREIEGLLDSPSRETALVRIQEVLNHLKFCLGKKLYEDEENLEIARSLKLLAGDIAKYSGDGHEPMNSATAEKE